MVWISLDFFPPLQTRSQTRNGVPVEGQAHFTTPSLLIKTIGPHIISRASLFSELQAFILSPANKALASQ